MPLPCIEPLCNEKGQELCPGSIIDFVQRPARLLTDGVLLFYLRVRGIKVGTEAVHEAIQARATPNTSLSWEKRQLVRLCAINQLAHEFPEHRSLLSLAVELKSYEIGDRLDELDDVDPEWNVPK